MEEFRLMCKQLNNTGHGDKIKHACELFSVFSAQCFVINEMRS